MKYDLRHETHEARCAWCWQTTGAVEAHAVVSPVSPPYTELHFHHRCWAVYRGLSGIEGRELKALYREWPPERVESLRLHAGLTLLDLAAKLRVAKERLLRHLSGQGRLGQRPIARLRGLAVDTRFEQQEVAAIDWSDRRACFCLCMHCGWTAGDLAHRLDVQDNTVTTWWDKGVPKLSVRQWVRLDGLAKQHGFDAGMLVDDHLWTPELVQEAIRTSALSQTAFAAVAGTGLATVRDAVQGRRRLNRMMAYYFTRAAAKLGLPLPPVGYIEPKRRTPRPFPAGKNA